MSRCRRPASWCSPACPAAGTRRCCICSPCVRRRPAAKSSSAARIRRAGAKRGAAPGCGNAPPRTKRFSLPISRFRKTRSAPRCSRASPAGTRGRMRAKRSLCSGSRARRAYTRIASPESSGVSGRSPARSPAKAACCFWTSRQTVSARRARRPCSRFSAKRRQISSSSSRRGMLSRSARTRAS